MTAEERFVVPEELPVWRQRIGADVPMAVVTGTFDVFQPGNLAALYRARAAAEHVLVIVEPDDMVARHASAGRPQNPLPTRVEMVTHLRAVSAVTTLDDHGATALLPRLAPFVWVTGRAQRGSDGFAAALRRASQVIETDWLAGCSTEEITRAIREHRTPVRLPEELFGEGEAPAAAAGTAVTVNGCFDILHIGHLRFLAAARSMGDSLTVLINDDASVRRYKGAARPVFPQRFRVAALRALASVDNVLTFAEDEPLAAIARLRPAIHVKGGSFEPERVRHERELLARWGGKVVSTPLVDGFSTSRYIQKALGAP